MSTIMVERLEMIQQDGEDIWVWRPTPVELDVENDFSIDDMELSREICRMGLLLVKYGGLAAELGAELQRKEADLKLVKAQCSGAIRSAAEASGTKMTEGKLDEQVIQRSEYQNSLAQLHILRASAVQVDHYWRSASKKADLLNALAFRQNAEIKKSGY
jgi:hypothetical protein